MGDVCGGDGTSCLDCAGIPFGPHVYVAVPQAPHHFRSHDYVYTDDDDDNDDYTSLNYYDNHGHADHHTFRPYTTDHSYHYQYISPGNNYESQHYDSPSHHPSSGSHHGHAQAHGFSHNRH